MELLFRFLGSLPGTKQAWKVSVSDDASDVNGAEIVVDADFLCNVDRQQNN